MGETPIARFIENMARESAAAADRLVADRDALRAQLAERDREIERLRAEFQRINVQDPELMEKVRGFVNAEHGLVVDMQDDTGRTGLYVETGFLRGLLGEIARMEAVEMSRGIALACEISDHKKTWEALSASQAREREAMEAHLRTIDQRDAAEDALSDAFRLVTGREPEWSNLFGYADAMEEITASLGQKESALAAARKALEDLLGCFVHPCHPGEAAMSAMVSVRELKRYRAALAPEQKG